MWLLDLAQKTGSKMQGNVNDSMKPRILLVTQAVGGVATHIEHILTFAGDRFEFTLIAPPSPLSDVARRVGARVEEYEFKREISPAADLAALFFLWRWCRNHPYEVYHYHSSKAGFYGRIVSVALGVGGRTLFTPNAISFLGFKGVKRVLFLCMERILSGVGCVIAVSKSEKITLERYLPGARVLLCRSGVVMCQCSGDTAATGNPEETSLVFSGRLTHQKNPEMFMRVAIRLLKEFPHLRVWMIGAGYHDEFSEKIRSTVKDNALESRFSVLSWVPAGENRRMLRSASVLVLTSRFESFGYVAAEAMEAGVPVVSTNVDGVCDLLEDGVSGYLVPTEDDDSMVSRIQELLQNPLLRKTMGAKGRERVEKQFRANEVMDELAEAYNRICTAGGCRETGFEKT
jgi:glycosyltransferase involved in cell wall biosynthesis